MESEEQMKLIDKDAIPWDVEGVGEIPVITKEEIDEMPTVELIRCKDCKHQRKEYREDKRRKAGGYNIYWCELVDGYAPLGFDDEYCAWAERKEE